MNVIIWYAKILGLFGGGIGAVILICFIANVWPEIIAVLAVCAVFVILELLRRA